MDKYSQLLTDIELLRAERDELRRHLVACSLKLERYRSEMATALFSGDERTRLGLLLGKAAFHLSMAANHYREKMLCSAGSHRIDYYRSQLANCLTMKDAVSQFYANRKTPAPR